MQRPDKDLIVSVVAKRAPGAIDPARQRRLRDDPAIPDLFDQFILADDPVMVAHQVDDEIENLGLNMDRFPSRRSSCWPRSISKSANGYFNTTSAHPI